MPDTVGLRHVRDSDLEFLQALYADSRSVEFAALQLEEAALQALLSMQFQAQRAQYRQRHPDSVDYIVTLDAADVGRCWVNSSDAGIRILDIAVLTRFRRQGVASRVIREFGAKAASGGRPMRLSVWHDNAAAIALYRTLGFQFHGEHNGYHELEWPAVAGDRRSLVSQEAATHE